MKTLLLLAGRSERFWPLKEKTLFSLCGKTLLEHQVERLREGGCTDIILVGGKHNIEQVQVLFPDLESVEQEDLSLGMQGALLSALPKCGSDPVFIVSSNDVIDPSGYKSVIEAAKAEGMDGAILAQEVSQYFPGGYLEVEGERITSIVEKPGEGNEPSNLVNIVAHIHNDPQTLLKTLQEVQNEKDDAYERALDQLFTQKAYKPVPYTKDWNPVKYPWHLLLLLSKLLEDQAEQCIHPTCEVHPSAVIEGNVVLEEGVKVYPHATIVGPCFIGRGSTVANNTLVRASSVGERCVIGYNTEVARSILQNGVWTHMNYIGDSVIGSNTAIGSGSVTGNFRLDEGEVYSIIKNEKIGTKMKKFGTVIGQNSRLGIHTTINPGVKIGEGSFVGGNILVDQDVPNESFVVLKEGKLMCKKNNCPPPPLRKGRVINPV